MLRRGGRSYIKQAQRCPSFQEVLSLGSLAGEAAAPQLPQALPRLLGAVIVPVAQQLPRRAPPQLQAGIQQLLLQALQQLLAGAQQPPQQPLLQRLEEGQQLLRPLQQLLPVEILRPMHQALLQRAGDYWGILTSEPITNPAV